MTDQFVTMLPWPAGDFSVFGDVEEKPLNKTQAYIAKAMHRNWASIPHVTHNDDADITQFEMRRKTWNEIHPENKRTLLPALITASVAALQEFPQFNTSLTADGNKLIQKHYYHIGFAVDVPAGLLVPVIRDCDKKSEEQIAKEITELAQKAKNTGLSMAEMSGGCFTLSSLGHIGGTSFSPIINAPEVAILGVTRTRSLFLPDQEGAPQLRQLLPFSLSYDHRVINGADAARFVRFIAHWLESYRFE